jgi:multiple sugar transport system permease protein
MTTLGKNYAHYDAAEPAPRHGRFHLTFDTYEKTMVYFFLIIGLVATLLPFFWMISSSFKSASEILKMPPTLLPENPTLKNYQTIFSDPRLPLLHFYANSLFVAAANVVITLFTSSLLGYVLAKYEFKGKQALFGWFMLTMMIPSQLTMIPNYLILTKLHLINTLWGLIVPSVINAFGIFMMRQFIMAIPNELIDAGRIDGATEWQIYLRLILPQLGPSLATLGTLTFMSNWNAYLWPMVVITKTDRRTLPVILTWYSTQHTNSPNLTMTATVLVVIPVLIIYFFFQRWIVRGVVTSGFK